MGLGSSAGSKDKLPWDTSYVQVPPYLSSSTMPALESSNNNQGLAATQNYIRDAKYYYHDGSRVFLVEGVLFKFQASIIVPDEDERSYEFESIMKPLQDPLSPPAANGEGSSDTNPIVIPGVEAEQFRDLLLVLLGRPDDWVYMSFLRGKQYGSNDSRDMLVRFADLSNLASRFKMIGLTFWGLNQISSFLGSLDLANYAWDKNILCKMLTALNSGPLTGEPSKPIDFILAILSMSIDNPTMPANRNRIWLRFRVDPLTWPSFGCLDRPFDPRGSSHIIHSTGASYMPPTGQVAQITMASQSARRSPTGCVLNMPQEV
ncbi:hypothetical protein BDV93DRAFT_254282 [Ceratobasidium sp. AG-I]|nr:hypothetical protein BDV93DRAFT_254282 [Ceratobasidium sp. AG-I]